MKALLLLQELDLKIEADKERERDIPKQKNKYEVQRKRLNAEVEEREQALKNLLLEQRTCDKDIEQLQLQMGKYQAQLNTVKKNEEYQALLHEIDVQKKQVGLKEERILSLMLELDECKARLEEDRRRVKEELAEIDRNCAVIDEELQKARSEREALEAKRADYAREVDPALCSKYDRIRRSKNIKSAVVPLRGDTCSGCNMTIRAQIVNEILAGKFQPCHFCGRLLYDADSLETASTGQTG